MKLYYAKFVFIFILVTTKKKSYLDPSHILVTNFISPTTQSQNDNVTVHRALGSLFN